MCNAVVHASCYRIVLLCELMVVWADGLGWMPKQLNVWTCSQCIYVSSVYSKCRQQNACVCLKQMSAHTISLSLPLRTTGFTTCTWANFSSTWHHTCCLLSAVNVENQDSPKREYLYKVLDTVEWEHLASHSWLWQWTGVKSRVQVRLLSMQLSFSEMVSDSLSQG